MNAGVEVRVVLAVSHVVRLEQLEALVKLHLLGIAGDCLFHETAHAIAYETLDFLQAPLGPAHLTQGIVGTLLEVIKGVGKSAVEVENYCFVFHIVWSV